MLDFFGFVLMVNPNGIQLFCNDAHSPVFDDSVMLLESSKDEEFPMIA